MEHVCSNVTLHANSVEPQDTIGLKGQSEFGQWVCKWKRMPADDTPADTLLSSLTKMSSLRLTHCWVLQSSFRCRLLMQNVHSQHFVCWRLISVIGALRTDL